MPKVNLYIHDIQNYRLTKKKQYVELKLRCLRFKWKNTSSYNSITHYLCEFNIRLHLFSEYKDEVYTNIYMELKKNIF